MLHIISQHLIFFLVTVLLLALTAGTLIAAYRKRGRLHRIADALDSKTRELDRFFDNALDLLCIADTNGRFRRLNQEWEKTLGYSREYLEASRFIDFVHPDDLPATMEAIKQLADQKAVLNFTNRYRCQDGSYRWIEWRSYPAGDLIYASARDITGRLRMERQLRESAERFEKYLAIAPNIFVLIDRNGNVALINKKGCDMVGYATDEIIGRNWFELCLPPHTRADMREMFSRIMDGEIDDYEFSDGEIFSRTGEVRLISWHHTVFRDETGTIELLLASGEDITERRHLEDELHRSRKLAIDILESISDGFFALDHNGFFTYVNMQAELIWGIRKEDIIGNHVSIILENAEFPYAYKMYQKAMTDRTTQQFEMHDDRRKKWLLVHFYPYADGLSVFFTDITERKKIESQLEYFANIDLLTEVFNRRAGILILENNIKTAVRERSALTICFIDVNGLKSVNDTFGHAEGDELIRMIVQSIQEALRDSDTVFRFGGDEFLIVMPKCTGDVVQHLIGRVQENIDALNASAEKPYVIAISHGYAEFPVNDPISVDDFIKMADIEMYKNKLALKK